MIAALLLGLLATGAAGGLGAAAAAAPAQPADDSVHIVRSGDTLWAIARRHGLSPLALAEANALDNPDRLRVGARLAIPWPGAPGRGIAVRGGVPARRPSLSWPNRGVVTSRFGLRGKRHHHGIDIAAPVGSPIAAARGGVVIFVGWRGAYGRLVILDHGEGLTTWYGHASRLLVRVGQRVLQGETIALVGASGEVTGPNVHFEVRRNETPLDPWPFLTGARL